ncbi:unnamed protein product [Clonostachys solani]|uniref:Uncharacterized protein n=1 Tax=Clonostachys solani TaxID=160281 RepID=A0A9N9W2Y4_9HYPO|nr:unnamed protein product [Clonostachys solani]
MAATEPAPSYLDEKPVAPDADLAPASASTSTKSRAESLAKKGEMLWEKIQETASAFVYLQASLSGRAKCRAGEDCLHFEPDMKQTNKIKDEYRICVYGTNLFPYGNGVLSKYYYHVPCFRSMISQQDLFDSGKFRLSDGKWGLMVRKWYEHQGCVDVDKISAYVRACKAHIAELEKGETQKVFHPGMYPTLGDYTLDAASQELEHILSHDDCMEVQAMVENN